MIAAERQALMALGTKVAHDYAARPGVLGSYLSGSLAAGLGTPGSDVDVMVVVADDHPGAGCEPIQHREGNHRVDVELVSASWVRRLGRLAEPYDATVATVRPWWINKGDLDAGVRLLLGTDVVPTPAVKDARDWLRTGSHELRRRLIALHCATFSGALEDVYGYLLDGDLRSAVRISANCVEAALEALLAACGQLYIGAKWIWRKLDAAQVAPADQTRCWDLLFGPVAPGAERDLVLTRVDSAQRMLVTAILDGWGEQPMPGWPAQHTAAPGPLLSRNPWFRPYPLADGPVLIDIHGRASRLSPAGLRLWLGFDAGRDDRGNVEAYLKDGDPTPPAEVLAYVADMRRAGLVARPMQSLAVVAPGDPPGPGHYSEVFR